MASAGPALQLVPLLGRDIVNGSDDPRVGSGRDNSTGGTISHALSSGTTSASLKSLGSTFVPVLAYSAIALLIFWTLRRRLARVYGPRSIPGIRPASEATAPNLPEGWFDWVKPFFLVPDSFVLNNCSVDGFFFLRYLKVLAIISAVGCCVSWPILLPVHGTGGRQLEQLDLLTIGNIESKVRFYAHVVVAWGYFGFIMYMISRECIYYINLRQAYLLSPRYAHRLSSRTVLFTCVPDRYLDEARLRKLFGDSVKSVWIPKNTNALRRLVQEREETAIRLEKAEIKLIKAANKSRKRQLDKQPRSLLTSYSKGLRRWGLPASEERIVVKDSARSDVEKAYRVDSMQEPPAETEKHDAKNKIQVLQRRVPAPESHGEPSGSASSSSSFRAQSPARRPGKVVDPDYVHPYGLNSSLADVNGSVAAQWVPASDRPSHRPLANFFRRVDTIKWTRNRLRALNRQIAKLRRKHRGGDGTNLNAAFVEFDTLANAQAAYQVLAHHQPLHMSPRFIGIRPHEIVWSALRMKWWERIIRRFVVMGAVAAAIIFWSIPSAFVGIASNIEFLSEKIPFLHWIASLPDVITGVIQGLLPALALSLLMAVVPVLLRICARAAGIPSHWMVELFVQNAYFVFQVVQVFLVTTLTSAASAAFSQILQNPLSAKDLLSQNLPKASNFYLSYILVQCMANGAGSLVHLFEIVRHQIVAKYSNNPRLTLKTWHKLRIVHWGSIYPVFTNMGVIAISYSCIAPLILLFSSLGMCCMYIVYKYNIIYVYDTGTLDSKGLFYPRALMHLMVGLYLAEICLIGLFALQVALPQLLLMLIYLIFTGLVHLSLNDALQPLMYGLPRTLALESEGFDSGGEANDDSPVAPTTTVNSQGGAAADYYDLEEQYGEEEQDDDDDEPVLDAGTTNRGVEGASGFMASVAGWTRTKVKADIKAEIEESGLSLWIAKLKQWATPDPDKPPNFFMRWLHPEIFDDFRSLREMVDQSLPDEDEDAEHARRGYWPPEMWVPTPRLWIPRDEARVSRQEVAHTSEVVPITDQGAWLDEKGRMVVDLKAAPFEVDATLSMKRFF